MAASSSVAPVPLLGGSWVVISGVISPLIWVIAIVTLLITTHEPPSRARVFYLPPSYDEPTLQGQCLGLKLRVLGFQS